MQQRDWKAHCNCQNNFQQHDKYFNKSQYKYPHKAPDNEGLHLVYIDVWMWNLDHQRGLPNEAWSTGDVAVQKNAEDPLDRTYHEWACTRDDQFQAQSRSNHTYETTRSCTEAPQIRTSEPYWKDWRQKGTGKTETEIYREPSGECQMRPETCRKPNYGTKNIYDQNINLGEILNQTCSVNDFPCIASQNAT